MPFVVADATQTVAGGVGRLENPAMLLLHYPTIIPNSCPACIYLSVGTSDVCVVSP